MCAGVRILWTKMCPLGCTFVNKNVDPLATKLLVEYIILNSLPDYTYLLFCSSSSSHDTRLPYVAVDISGIPALQFPDRHDPVNNRDPVRIPAHQLQDTRESPLTSLKAFPLVVTTELVISYCVQHLPLCLAVPLQKIGPKPKT